MRKSSAADVGHVERKNGVSIDAKGEGELSALICDTCAARNFPETSVDAAAKLRFRFGDDGPVMAVEVAVDVPKIRVDLQPPAVEFSAGKGGEAGADRRGGMLVEADGFELSYKRTTHRRGGLEASLRAVTVSDPCPETAFPRILSPGVARCLKANACDEKNTHLVVQRLGGGGDTTITSPGWSPKQPLPRIGLHDLLYGRQACPEFNSFHHGVGQICPREGLFSCRPLSKRGQICDIPDPPNR